MCGASCCVGISHDINKANQERKIAQGLRASFAYLNLADSDLARKSAPK